MSQKLQLSPVFSTRESPLHMPIQARWGALPNHLEGAKFFRSWLVYDSDFDSDFEQSRTRGHVNWNMIAGLALMVVVSAAGWGGVIWLVAQLWK